MLLRCYDVGLIPAEGPVEEDLSQQHRDGVPGPQVLAEDVPQLHCGKGAGQLANEEWDHFYQVNVLMTLKGVFHGTTHE